MSNSLVKSNSKQDNFEDYLAFQQERKEDILKVNRDFLTLNGTPLIYIN